MISRYLGVILFSQVVFVQAQEKISDIDSLTIQGKFVSLSYKNANQNITIITRKDIDKSPSNSIDELLQQIPGMDIRRRGGNGVQSDVSFRGSSFEQVLILINGIRMNDSQTGHNSLNLPINLDNVDRIEVIKGPAARRFGQNAFAGAINIITKPYLGKNIKISATGGDYSSYGLGLNANMGNEKFSQSFQTNISSSEGYRYNTDFEIRNAYYQNQLSIKNGSIRLQAGISEKKFGANGFYSSPKATEQYEELQASIVSLAHQQSFGKFKINSNIYWRRGQDMYLFNREKPEIYRNMHIGNNVGGEVNASYLSNLGTTGVGVELRKEFLASNNLGHRERFVTQLFFEHNFSLFDHKLQITPGASWANYSNAGNFFYPGLDLGYSFDNHHKAYANVSKVHRVPTFTDLYYTSKTEKGNENLTPESALYSELGYQFHQKNWMAKISGFLRNSNDAIDWTKSSLEDPIWYAEKIGKIEVKGVEVEVANQATNWLKYSLGYSYLDNKLKNSNLQVSRYVLDNLKHQFIAKLQTQFLKNFGNEIVYRYNDRLNLGSYHVVDEKLSFSKKDLSIYVLVNNITNSIYTETFGIPMSKRWFHIGFTYNINVK